MVNSSWLAEIYDFSGVRQAVLDEVISMRVDQFPGGPEESGFAHGRTLRDLLEPAFRERYITEIGRVIAYEREDLRSQAARWLDELPEHFQLEIDAMAAGGGLAAIKVAEFLFADIAKSTEGAERNTPIGPMCSALLSGCARGSLWIARNCDWLRPTLLRGVSAVVHEAPNRIPMMSMGIRGDIDADTGINAEGLWLHIHTMHARDRVVEGEPVHSWLFWGREALETCATIDELEAFARRMQRDQGLMAIVGHGPTNAGCVFECTRTTTRRHDIDPRDPRCVTNHPLSKPLPSYAGHAAQGTQRSSGTISRLRAMRQHIEDTPPRRFPDDLKQLLASEGVEMRTPEWIRTIYAAVVNPQTQTVWFASGDHGGAPAASTGAWSRVRPPWVGARGVLI